MPTAPLVTVVLSVHNGERHLQQAVASVLGQTVSDWELVVIDDASTDATPDLLAAVADERLIVRRSDEQRGLAISLNAALDEARGRYVARLDADDLALPHRLERQLERIRGLPDVSIVGSSVLEIDEAGRVGQLHLMPQGPDAIRFAALFSSPFFHPSVLVERELFEENGLRYDPEYLESEDYELWSRALAMADGDNVLEPLVLYRVHPGQASMRRAELQRRFQRRVAERALERVAPALSAERRELAWQVGYGEVTEASRVEEAVDAYVEVVHAFESEATSSAGVREMAARAVARASSTASGPARARVLAAAARLDPALPLHASRRRVRRRSLGRTARPLARRTLRDASAPIRVAAVFPEPTPYRAPLLDRVADEPEIDLTVIYAAETVASRTWRVQPHHRAVFLRGVSLPGARRLLHHDYPLTPGVVGALERAEPDVVVASGWSTFAAQAAIAWSRARGVPYMLVVESHDEGPRPGWRRKVKGTVVPPVVRGSAGALVTGTLARRSMIARGAAPERVWVFANTIDVEAFGDRADELRPRRDELRTELGAGPDDVIVLSVARLAPEKGHDRLVHALAEAGREELLLVLAGGGPEAESLQDLARVRGVRLTLAGDLEWERIVEVYVAADVFALLSEREPWAVVVNEAAACGLPLVLSDRVGAAHDLLRDGENGYLVAAGDVDAASGALRRLAADPELRASQGARSRELARDWGYRPSVQGFVTAVREAVSESGRIRS